MRYVIRLLSATVRYFIVYHDTLDMAMAHIQIHFALSLRLFSKAAKIINRVFKIVFP